MNASQMKINSITDLGDLAVRHLTNFAVLTAFSVAIVFCVFHALKAAGCNELTVKVGSYACMCAMGVTLLWMMGKLLTA